MNSFNKIRAAIKSTNRRIRIIPDDPKDKDVAEQLECLVNFEIRENLIDWRDQKWTSYDC